MALGEMELSDRNRQLLRFIQRYSLEKGFPPTLAECGKGVGIVKSHAWSTLKQLKGLGFVDYEQGKPRTIRLTDQGKKAIKEGAEAR